jgi:hypothetical protein
VLISAPVLCLICQKHSTRLQRHLKRVHAFSVEQYRALFPLLDVAIVELTDECNVVDGRAQLPPGARRADGRDADRARQYQRDRRAGVKKVAVPSRSRSESPQRAAEVDRIVRAYLEGRPM